MRLAPLLLLLAAACAGPRLKPFATDGCTLFPDGTAQDKHLWRHCCVAHDRRCWMGGTKSERREADRALGECVAAVGKPKTGEWMRMGVRAGGTPYLPTGFRWGFGWRYPRGYKPLTNEERRLVQEKEGASP